ncbi:MAG: O-methyltransferase [Bacteriovoracaceae bacterium]
MIKKREGYCLSYSSKPSNVRQALAKFTRENVADSNMLIGELEGAFFQYLIKTSGMKSILEIGTYTGYSALTFAEALPEDGIVLTLDINSETTALAQSFWNQSTDGKKIQSFVGNTHTKIEELIKSNVMFDAIFVDADKENYPHYVTWAKNLLNVGGSLIIDNVLWDNRVLDPSNTELCTLGIKKACNLVYSDQETWETVMIPVRDGVMLARKK